MRGPDYDAYEAEPYRNSRGNGLSDSSRRSNYSMDSLEGSLSNLHPDNNVSVSMG